MSRFSRKVGACFQGGPFIFFNSISVLTLLCLNVSLHAQSQNLVFEEISIEQGLSQSIVFCILQDSKGFLWFGTEDGLNKYDGYKFTVLQHDPYNSNSLSYNEIRAIHEDSSGVLWIGAFYGGLNKYDPDQQQFTRYQHEPTNPRSLSHNNVKAIYEDKAGVLWIATDGGLNRFDRETEQFKRYQHDPANPNSLSNDILRDIYEDKSGVLWIATEDGLNAFDRQTESFRVYRHLPANPNSLSNDLVTSICEDQSGRLWIGTFSGLNRLDPARKRFTRYRNERDNPNSLSHDEIRAIFEDSSGLLWIGTNGGGLNLYDRENETFIRYHNDPQNPKSLSKDEIFSIYEDRSGILWLGTYGGGTNKVEKRRKQFGLYKPDPNHPNALTHEIVWSIYEDDSGLLWIGTHGGGLTRFDRKQNRCTHYTHNPNDPNSISSNIVRVVYPDPTGQFWIGTNGGGICKFDRATETFTRYLHDPGDPTSLSHNEIRAIYKDRSGVLWVGTNGGGLNKLVSDRTAASPAVFTRYTNDPDNPNGLSSNFVRVIYEDPDEAGRVLWLGTQGGGLNKFDRKTGTFTQYRADARNPNKLNNDYIFALHEDRDGIFWIATWGGGLNRFDRTDGTFTNYTVHDGLPDNQIYGILEDDGGNLWLSTNRGLSKFDPRTETCKNYTVDDGLQSNEFNGGSYFKSQSGELFFGGIHGFNAFYPQNIKDNPYIPPVAVTAFFKFNKEVHLKRPISQMKELHLSYKDYVFSFEFAALDFTAPMKNKYAYKMEGLDQEWYYTGSAKRFATYTTLPPGTYRFKVKGSNNDGVWNEVGTEIRIIIHPPFWQTWWFRALLVVVLTGLALILYKRRLKHVRMKAELKAAHDAQMSIMPHGDPQIPAFDISGICLPANEVGGDFYDYFWIDKERSRFGIAIGDVSGKAMESAMAAVMTDGMIYLEGDRADSVRDILNRVNRSIYQKTDKKMFTALCLASLNLRTKEVTFSNAGLLEPLLKSNGSVTSIGAANHSYPLGLIEDNIYQETSLQLGPGNILVFVTDGITEAQNRFKELYGENKLSDLLAGMQTSALTAEDIKNRIIRDVQKFAGSAPQYDDMTVIVVKVVN